MVRPISLFTLRPETERKSSHRLTQIFTDGGQGPEIYILKTSVFHRWQDLPRLWLVTDSEYGARVFLPRGRLL